MPLERFGICSWWKQQIYSQWEQYIVLCTINSVMTTKWIWSLQNYRHYLILDSAQMPHFLSIQNSKRRELRNGNNENKHAFHFYENKHAISILSPCIMPKSFQASSIKNELKIRIGTSATNIANIKMKTKCYTGSDFQWRCSFKYKRINELWKIFYSPLAMALSCFFSFRCAP